MRNRLIVATPRVRGTTLPPLWLAGVTLALCCWVGVFYVPLFFQRFPQPLQFLDFSNYLTGAWVGSHDGWTHLYDIGAQVRAYAELYPNQPALTPLEYFLSPPPVAWMALPLTALPSAWAFWVWMPVTAAAAGLAFWLTSPVTGFGTFPAVLLVLTLWPSLEAFQTGQVVPLLGSAVLFGVRLRAAGHPVAAGALIGLAALKPQDFWFLPLAFVAARDWRLLGAAASSSALLAVASLASVGTHGLASLRTDLAIEASLPSNAYWTLATLAGSGAVAVEVVLAAIAVLAIWLRRSEPVELPVAIALIASLLVGPYHHSNDFFLLLPAAWLWLRTGAPWWRLGWAGVGVLACYLSAPFGPAALLLFSGAWLVLLAVEGPPVRRRLPA